MSGVALAGWIVLGVFCAGALGVMGTGAYAVFVAQRTTKQKLVRLQETAGQRLSVDRFQAAANRLSRDAAVAGELVQRAQCALGTISKAVRYAMLAMRVIRYVR